MAGTGHAYEIANMCHVRDLVSSLQSHCRTDEARAWFATPRFLRYLTSEEFTIPLDLGSREMVRDSCDPGELDPLLRKLASHGAVRFFLRPKLGRAEADLENVAHWASTLAGREASKLRRMAVADAMAYARDWVRAVAKEGSGLAGTVECALSFVDGKMWMRLLDETALRAEGNSMSHCVGNSHYAGRLGHGGSFYSLRAGGRSKVTAYFREDRNGHPVLAEVRGKGNSVIGHEDLGRLCGLMDCVGARPSEVAAMAGVIHTDEGWKRITEVWKQKKILGFKAVVEGRDAVVMSPMKPDLPLARILLGDNGLARVTSLDQRHYHADELRALARLMREIGDVSSQSNSSAGGPCIVVRDGMAIPWFEAYEKKEFGGVECLYVPQGDMDTVMVPHSQDDARILLHVKVRPENGDGEENPNWTSGSKAPVHALSPERWNETETRRCLAVMTAAGITHAGHDEAWEAISARFRPVFHDGAWRAFLSECTKRAVGDGFEWKETSYRGELRSPTGWNACTVTLTPDGKSHAPFISSGEHGKRAASEAARWLNRAGALPQEGQIGPLLPTRPFPAVFWAAGRWRSAASHAELVRKTLGPVKRLGLSRAEARGLLPLLQGPKSKGRQAELVALCLVAWAREWKRDDQPMFRGTLGFIDASWNSSTPGLLDAAVAPEIRRHLDDADMKALGRVAAACLKALCSGRGRHMGWDSRNAAISILQEWHAWVPDAVVAKTLKRVLKSYGGVATNGNALPHRAWASTLLAKASALGLAYSLRMALFHDLTRWKSDPVENDDDADRLADLAEASFAAGRWQRSCLFADYAAQVAATMDAAGARNGSARFAAAAMKIASVARMAAEEDEASRRPPLAA